MGNTIHSHILQLQEAMKQNRLVVFVGAGASASVGVPTWPKLIQSFKPELPPELYDEGDPLKTAEVYRELRGDVEYLSHVKKVLRSGEVSCCAVHDAIMHLNPCHIVTTNYDDLLEQAAVQNNKQYYVVAKDEDLPLNKGERMIIKMHGDFLNNNIVLTENDYYDYRSNFPLINSFLMSLFATKVVLFVGFSFSDINLKFILRQVSNVLGNKMQRVYLLTDDEKDALAYSYFKSKSVQLLSIPESVSKAIIKEQRIECEGAEVLLGRSKALCQSLCVLSGYDPHYDSLIDKTIDALMANRDQIRYYGKHLNLVFNTSSRPWVRIDETSLILLTDHYKKQFSDIVKQRKSKTEEYKKIEDKVDWITQTLFENGIRTIENKPLYADDQGAELINSKIEDVLSGFFRLSFEDIEIAWQRLTQRSLTFTTDDLALPFLQYRLGLYIEAYRSYKMLASEMWKHRKYVLYFICLYNMNATFGRAFMQMSSRKEETNHEMDYMQKFRLVEILDTIPVDKNIKEILNGLATGGQLKEFRIKTSELADKLYEQRKSAERGGWSVNSNVILLLREYIHAFHFCNDNYIITDAYENAKNSYVKIGEGLIHSALTTVHKGTLASKLEVLPTMSVALYVFLIETDNFKKVLWKAEGNLIPVEDGFKEWLNDLVRNMANDITKNPRERLLNARLAISYLSNIILLQNAIDNPSEMPELYKLLAAYWGNGLQIDNAVKVALRRMISIQKPSPKDALQLLKSMSQASSSRESTEANIIHDLAEIVHEGGLELSDFPNLNFVVQNQGIECLSAYYHAMSPEDQRELKEYIQSNVTNMCDLMNAERHAKAHYVTKELIEKLEPTIGQEHNLYREPEELTCRMLVHLMQDEDYADLHKTIEAIKKNNDVLRFLCAPEDFPLGNIKVRWLRYINEEQLKILFKHKEIRRRVALYCEKHPEESYLKERLSNFDME